MKFYSNMMVYKILKKSIFTVITLLFTLLIIVAPFQNVNAQEKLCSEGKLRNLQVSIINCKGDEECSIGSATSAVGGLSSGDTVYILGDSITVGATPLYKTKYQEKQITPVINSFNGRSWNSGGSGTSAKSAVDQDSSTIQSAKGVVVALGSNGGLGSNPIPEVIDKIRSINPSVPIWWVNTAGTIKYTSVNLGYLGPFNQALVENASSKNFKIIDWFKVVNPNGDPTISPTQDPSGLLGDGLHPNSSGYPKLVDLVVSSTTTSAGAPAGTSGGCQCGATPLAGVDNAEKIWNFLLSKGLNAVQSSGVLGNLKAESGNQLNPKVVEMGWGFPKEMDTIPPATGPAGQPGYGLIQWTSPGRKKGLQDMATARNLPVYDLGLQLEYMWSELESPYYKSKALDPLRATNDLAEATRIWQEKFEVGKHFEPRFKYAQEVMVKFGAGSSGGSTSSTTGCAGSESAGLQGVTCPATLEPHPSKKGYFKFPDAPNGEYQIYSTQEQRYGSKQLVCVIYSVALAFNTQMAGKSKLRVGDLNASGHKSHNKGIAVDLSGFGQLQVASHTKSWKGTYDRSATVALGKLFADTGVLRNIWWCDPKDGSADEIKEYAKTKGLEGDIKCISGHEDHFHVDIKQENKLEEWAP